MSEPNWLRCRLRAVNIEYSALVRHKVGEAAYARMGELRTERRVLMALIAVERHVTAMKRALRARPVRPAALGSAYRGSELPQQPPAPEGSMESSLRSRRARELVGATLP